VLGRFPVFCLQKRLFHVALHGSAADTSDAIKRKVQSI